MVIIDIAKEFLVTNITLFDFFLVLISLLIFIFSKQIIDFLDTSDLEKKNLNGKDLKNIEKKEKFLRGLTLFIIVLYFTTFYIQTPFLNDIVKLFFVGVVIYFIDAFIKRKILLFYGNEIEIGGEKYIKRGYKTQIFSLITSIISSIFFIYLLFKIFGIDSLLEGGGIMAGILAFLGFTAPVWAKDLIASIMILHNGEVETGNVVRISESGVLAWIKNINLSEVKMIDLVYGHPIIMRPSEFRDNKIENLSNGVVGRRVNMLCSLDIKVGYDIDKNKLEDLVFGAFETMIEQFQYNTIERQYFPEEPKKYLEIDSFGDDAIIYKFGYYITSPFYMVKASRLLNDFLLKKQKETGVYFSTPKLITVTK